MNPTHVMGRRVGAFIIDYVLLSLAFGGIFYALAHHTTGTVHLTGTHLDVTFDRDTYYVQGDDATRFFGIELGVALLYAGLIQGLAGATIGKLICGIRVMREDGSRPGMLRGALRWVLLIVDDFPYFIPMLTGFIVALSNDRRRRVGDMAAGTFVVRAGIAGVPAPGTMRAVPGPTAPPGAWPPAPDPAFGQSAAAGAARAAVGDTRPSPTPQPVRAQAPEPPLPPPPMPLPPANWYPDPAGRARLRYWDGSRWTDHTAP